MKNSTFISYSKSDAGFALQLANDLRASGVSTWLDQLDIPPGTHKDNAIETALNNAACVLAIISARLMASKTAVDEISYALEQNKKVILVLLDHTETSFRLRKLQRVDFTADYSKAVTELIAILTATTASTTQKNTASGYKQPFEKTSGTIPKKKIYAVVFVAIVVSAALAWTVVKLVNQPADIALNRDPKNIRVVTNATDSTNAAEKEIQVTNEVPYVEIVKAGEVKPAQNKVKEAPENPPPTIDSGKITDADRQDAVPPAKNNNSGEPAKDSIDTVKAPAPQPITPKELTIYNEVLFEVVLEHLPDMDSRREHQPVKFVATNAVVYNGITLIDKGAIAEGSISLGRRQATLVIKHIRGTDGQIIALKTKEPGVSLKNIKLNQPYPVAIKKGIKLFF